MVHEIWDDAELAALCDGDPICVWAAQGFTGTSRAWTGADRRAVAVAAPALSARDRLVLHGDPDSAARLVEAVLSEVGPAFRPLGDRALVEQVAQQVPALTYVGSFGWMDGTAADIGPAPASTAAWLPRTAEPEVAALLQRHYPGSYAKPGIPGVRRWAGIRDDTGALVAVGADAWSAPTVGLVGGIAVRPAARGRGTGRRLVGFLLAEAVRGYGRAALMVDDDNDPALRLYKSLGLRYRPVGAATSQVTPT